MKSLVCLLLVVTSAASMAKCAMRGKMAVLSPGHHYKLNLDPDGSFKITRVSDQSVVSKGTLTLVGHHYDAWISDSGDRIVLVDEYQGYGVFDRKGKAIKTADTATFLTKSEVAGTPRKWACHPEGIWLGQYKVTERALSMALYNKRVVNVPLR